MARPILRLLGACIALGSPLADAAIDIDGNKIVEPLSEGDAVPIADINTYYPDLHDCPLPCADNANIHSWTPYYSVQRLDRCEEPLLLQFTVNQLLDDPESSILIRSCSLVPKPAASALFSSLSDDSAVENPKKLEAYSHGFDSIKAPACAADGAEVPDKMTLHVVADSDSDANPATALLDGMYGFFQNEDNCDESFAFGYHRGTAAAAYIGAGLGKRTIQTALKAVKDFAHSEGRGSSKIIAQLCDGGREPGRIAGISIDTSGNLAAIQKMALGWSNGECSKNTRSTEQPLSAAKVFDIAGEPFDLSNSTAANITTNATLSSRFVSRMASGLGSGVVNIRDSLQNRGTCRSERILQDDGCPAIAGRCGISPADFTKYNSKLNCAALRPGSYACCSEGDPYSPPKPKPEADGTCKTHLIGAGDDCSKLAGENGLTIEEIEGFNRGKTWAWTECKDMLQGYNMCLSEGTPPMPPPQAGTQCGPLVPGTPKPKPGVSLADLNPCPLNSCCSNWGYCGVFPAHCAINAPEGGGPGSKKKGFQNTCISNCGNEIKQNSGPPESFQRIGYYESYGMERDCLKLKAKNANTDGSYTHIHWAFASIERGTWKPIINDKHDQWKDFKTLQNVKRIVSFGGWADSTEPATFDIIRKAILENRNTFVDNLVKFANDEGIDGIDIDWEYPGAPDILVNGQPIGQKGDGVGYLRFLTALKSKMGNKSVSIAAPASYWYLQAFPIDRIAKVIDYIVYMTYDLHGQWDYGNPNAYDKCDSGKCIRSHVNLTETGNSLAMLTKAGVPNNKVFVGESSYGRSFRMAEDGCWGPMCEFTGSRTESNANPGRCTKTSGYISFAEITEIIRRSGGAKGFRVFHDGASNSDILLYNGDYVSYMTPTTKETRRADWKGLNFAGSIDWAVDLQAFTSDDFEDLPERPEGGTGCILGEDLTLDSASLCEFTCELGFCPDTACSCQDFGPLNPLPNEGSANGRAIDEFDLDINRLCNFACKYGYCPEDVCTRNPTGTTDVSPPVPTQEYDYKEVANREAFGKCIIYREKTPELDRATKNNCVNSCAREIKQAQEDGTSVNYGCVGFWPGPGPIPWQRGIGGGDRDSSIGLCICNDPLVDILVDTMIDAMEAIGQIGCYIMMSALKAVLDIGLKLFPAGRVLDAGLDAVTSAVKLINHVYGDEDDRQASWEWWLSPCGGTDLVPDELKKAFEIIEQATDLASFKIPKGIGKNSGKKGDKTNPGRGKPRVPHPPPKNNNNNNGNNNNNNNGNNKKKCNPGDEKLERLGAGKNTLRVRSCDKQHKTETVDYVVSTLTYGPRPTALSIKKECPLAAGQACFHYSSAIRNNGQWATLTCPPEAAVTSHRFNGKAVGQWDRSHKKSWRDSKDRLDPSVKSCQIDEYPPAYLLASDSVEFLQGGKDRKGQRVRYISADDNRAGGNLFKGVCFKDPLQKLTDAQLKSKVGKAQQTWNHNAKTKHQQWYVGISVDSRPEFSLTWAHAANPPRNDGLFDNQCWPHQLARGDPGFNIWNGDEWYDTNPATDPNDNPSGQRGPRWDYNSEYAKGTNGH